MMDNMCFLSFYTCMNEAVLMRENQKRVKAHFDQVLPKSFTSLLQSPLEYFQISPFLVAKTTIKELANRATIKAFSLAKKGKFNFIHAQHEITVAHIEKTEERITVWGTMWTNPRSTKIGSNQKRILERMVELRINTSETKSVNHIQYSPSLLFLLPLNEFEADLAKVTLPSDTEIVTIWDKTVFSSDMINYVYTFIQRVDDGLSFASLTLDCDYFPEFIINDILNQFKKQPQFTHKEIVTSVFTSVFSGLISHYSFLLNDIPNLQFRIFNFIEMFFGYSRNQNGSQFEQKQDNYHFINPIKIAGNLAYYSVTYLKILDDAELKELQLLASQGKIPDLLNKIVDSVYTLTSKKGKASFEHWRECMKQRALEGDFIPF
jgi:hypothetical protein